MKLKSIQLTNFRCFRDEHIDVSNYSVFIGANNGDKSTILSAVQKFFRSTPKKIYQLRPMTFIAKALAS